MIIPYYRYKNYLKNFVRRIFSTPTSHVEPHDRLMIHYPYTGSSKVYVFIWSDLSFYDVVFREGLVVDGTKVVVRLQLLTQFVRDLKPH